MHKDTKEIENKNKKVIGIVAFLFVIFHFSIIIITILPEYYTSNEIKKSSNYYVSPLFSQSWSMFAPCPLFEHKLKYKLFSSTDSTDFIIPSTKNNKYHSIFRFSHHGDLLIGEYNLLYWVKLDLDKLKIKPNHTLTLKELKLFNNSYGGFCLRNYFKGIMNNQKTKKFSTAIFYLEYFNVKTKVLNNYIIDFSLNE